MVAPWGSVRVRTTLLATVVTAAALAVAAVALLAVLGHSLERTGDDAARARARDLAGLVATAPLPRTLTPTGDDDDVVQVIDRNGVVVASTPNARTRVTELAAAGGTPVVREVTGVHDGVQRERYRMWVVRARGAGGPVTIYVGSSLETVPEAVSAVRRALLLGLPPLVALLGLGTWLLVGRALHPVESIRTQVADITGRALHRRVPVPSSGDEIARLARTMNAMLDRLEDASSRQRSFVGDASHELQGPIAAFRTQLEVALAHPGTTDWPATARDLSASSAGMERLVRDLLYLAREDAADAQAPTDAVDLDDVVLEEAARLRPSSVHDIDTVRVSAAPVRGSRDQLTRLVRNLLENADRYAASVVRVELDLTDGEALLVVADDGPGVPVEHHVQVFDRFFRVDSARPRGTGGAGLGLAIARSIAQRHGGSIALASDGPGARFEVRVPSVSALRDSGVVKPVERLQPVARLRAGRLDDADNERLHQR